MDTPIKLLPLKVDIKSLQEKLIDNPQLFNNYAHRRVAPANISTELSPHRECSDIWVRYGDIDTIGTSVFIDKHESVWYKISEEIPEVIDIANYLMYKLGGLQLGGILITKLSPGSKIYPHTDTIGWHPNYYDKFYIPILNKEGAAFEFENLNEITSICGEEGSVYWFRNNIPHWVINNSNSDRIALVITLKPKNMEFLNV